MKKNIIEKKPLLPLYKWSWGKRKEIKEFESYFPDFVKDKENYTYVEPFFWGGAVFWYLENQKNIINDIDKDLILFLKELKQNPDKIKKMAKEVSEYISVITKKEKEGELSIKDAKIERWKIYYKWRSKDKDGWLDTLTNIDRAFRFFIVNQLAFSGMRRFNSKGEFNVPYWNYKSFNLNLEQRHLDLLNNTEIFSTDYKEIMKENDKENTFIYVDPPYTREFKEYSHDNVFWEKQHIELFNTFKNMKKAKVMIVINKDDFTYNLYKDYIKAEYNLKYSTNIKNRYDNNVTHLIITNYQNLN